MASLRKAAQSATKTPIKTPVVATTGLRLARLLGAK
jgi:hypothetical protein